MKKPTRQTDRHVEAVLAALDVLAGSPRRAKPSRTAATCEASTPKSRPPDVSDSQRSFTSASGTAGSIRSRPRTPKASSRWRRLRPMPPLKLPRSASASAPGSSGRSRLRSVSPASEASTISPAWPSRPKPVMSVAPVAPASWATSAATRFSRSMLCTAPSSTAGSQTSFLAAVAITPVPSGFERKTRCPARRPPLRSMRRGSTRPVTQRPYLGSASTTVCPPATTPPASRTLSAPPRKTAAMISLGRSRGKPATFRAKSTCPPMAYTSDIELTAAIAP